MSTSLPTTSPPPVTVPVGSRASINAAPGGSTVSHSTNHTDDTAAGNTSVTEWDESGEGDESVEGDERGEGGESDDEGSSCGTTRLASHVQGGALAHAAIGLHLSKFNFKGQVYSVPYHEVSVVGFHYVRNMVLESSVRWSTGIFGVDPAQLTHHRHLLLINALFLTPQGVAFQPSYDVALPRYSLSSWKLVLWVAETTRIRRYKRVYS
ncbi:hypothetical protein DFP73DRAFT_529806 [Morchella snyderi]|nr:hypothetical protein DFP73DRAFT_529806 [Morchella snyderi]